MIGCAVDVLKTLAAKDSEPPPSPQHSAPHKIEALCFALISGDASALPARRFDSNRVRLLADLTAAARLLGDWWVQDRVTFADVAAGTDGIFQILSELGETPVVLHEPQRIPVIFASVPGEQHTLGVRMAAEIFRMDGWEITLKIGYDQDALVSHIEQLPRCIVGLSIGGEHSLRALERLTIAFGRRCSQASTVICGQDIEAIRPKISSMDISEIGGDIEEAKIVISSLWDRDNRLADLDRRAWAQ